MLGLYYAGARIEQPRAEMTATVGEDLAAAGSVLRTRLTWPA